MIYFRDNLYVIKTLKEFQYIDEEGKDQGANVRQKAKDITNLLQDESRLREERRSRAHMRDRMIKANGGEEGGPSSFDEDENVVRRRNNRAPGAGAPKEDDELKRAIEESKRSHAVEQAKAAEERDLEQAIKLSEEEEAKRHKAVEDSNSSALFDDTNQLCVVPLLMRLIFLTALTVPRQPQQTRSHSMTRILTPTFSLNTPNSSLSLPRCSLNSLQQYNLSSPPSTLTSNKHNRKLSR